MTKYIRLICTLILLQISQFASAFELSGATVPVTLRETYIQRYHDPLNCIKATKQYLQQQQQNNISTSVSSYTQTNSNPFATQLLALCYTQIEDYPLALETLLPLLKAPSLSDNEIRTLIILSSEIPEQEHQQLSNQFLIKKLTESLQHLEEKTFTDTTDLAINLLFTISKLSLQTDHYQETNVALEKIKNLLKNKKSKEFEAWLNYYYGLYYDQINQPQLASSYFLSANKLADQNNLIKLSGEVKDSIAKIYQQKHRFPIALDFSSQRVELYLSTKNNIKQASSLIQFAILKRQNNEINQSLIYLFNALELIQSNKNSSLLAHVYLEIGRSYMAVPDKKNNLKERELAQKYLQNSRFHFTRLNQPRFQIESLLLLAQLNIINQDPALAILQLEKVLKLSTKKYLSLRVQAFEILALSYEITGNHEQAIVHFKNFHALQNRIKERLFKLQQLKISEQLQLFEKTQQKKHLETENSNLTLEKNSFKTISYGALLLLTLMSILCFHTLTRNKKLSASEQEAKQKLEHHQRTELPSQQANSNQFNYVYHGVPLYYALVNIPFLAQLNELVGILEASKLEERLGEALKITLTDKVDIFQVRDNQILFICKQTNYEKASDFTQSIELFFNDFASTHRLPKNISCGIAAFPFLNNSSRAITPTRMLDLTSLALFAASQIRDDKQQSSWVELYAIDNLQPAFFDGDLWELGQVAIEKGIVKINSSHANHAFAWPKNRK